MPLLNQAAAGAAPMGQPAPAPAAAPAPTQGGQIPTQGGQGDPAVFKEAMRVASNALYDEQVFSGIVEAAGRGQVREALSSTVALIIGQTEQAVGQLDIDSILALILALVFDAADALTKGGVTLEEDEVMAIVSDTISVFLQQNQGRFSKEELEGAVMRMQEEAQNLDTGEYEQGGAAPAAPGGGMLSQGA